MGGQVLKRWFALLLCLVMALPLGGCTSVSLVPVQQMGDVALPLPKEKIPAAPTGDSRSESSARVSLYFISADQKQLTPLSRTMLVKGEDTLTERTLKRLLDAEDSGPAGLMPVAPAGTRVEWIEQSQGVVTLSLTMDALKLDAPAMCWMEAAIADTLTALNGIRYVNVLIDGKAESATMIPAGTLSRTDLNLTALWTQRQDDDERLDADPALAAIGRDATLYFAGWSGDRMLPEVRPITLNTHEFAEVLIEELRKGPRGTAQAHAVLPQDARLKYAPDIDMLDDGRRVLKLAFEGDLFALLKRDGLSAWQMFGALSLTLCRFIPELDGLRIWVGDDTSLVTKLTDGVRRYSFPDGVVSPDMFEVGRVARLYFAGADGALTAVDRLVDQYSAVSPRALLEQLIDGPLVFDGGAKPVMPDGVADADLLGIRIEERTALVNLSSNFYRLCQGLTPDEERNLIYAMVNTLCELDFVNRVRFYVAGATVDTLTRDIFLRGALLPNPGLVGRTDH